MTYSIYTIPALADNYAYAIVCDKSGNTLLIDAPESNAVLQFLVDDKYLDIIAITHHHNDHINGVNSLVESTNCRIFGNKADKHRLPVLNMDVCGQGKFLFNDDLEVFVFNSDGHTIGSVSYYIPALSAIFVGDLLFTMGCGSMFEGDKNSFFASIDKIKKLPDDTRIYGGHEYTVNNIKFAKSLCDDLDFEYLETLEKLIYAGLSTVPAFLDKERKNNPFLKASNADEFLAYRTAKDNFKI